MDLQVQYTQEYTTLTPMSRVGSVKLSGMCHLEKGKASADPDVFHLYGLSVRKKSRTVMGLYLL